MKPERTPMNPTIRNLVAGLAFSASFAAAPLLVAGPTVSNVTAQQRPDTKLVDIGYDLDHDEDLPSTVTIEATIDEETWTLLTDLSSSGAHGFGVVEGLGKAVVWDAGEEWPSQLFPTVKIRIRANDGTGGGVDPAAFSLIPAGAFMMGSPANELGRFEGMEALHEVKLNNSFYISKTEVTWGDWSSVRTYAVANGYDDIGSGSAGGNEASADNHPVTNVSWWDAIKYCNARSEQEGKTPVYYASDAFEEVFRTGSSNVFANFEANGYRLPTEAEWEYACRAGTTTAFYTGAITQATGDDPNLNLAGWYAVNSGSSNTEAVAQLEANAWGLYDTHGNVWEWCWDWHVNGLGNDFVEDPKGPASGTNRVFRGGGYKDEARSCRSARRFRFGPGNSDVTLGFRVAVSSTL